MATGSHAGSFAGGFIKSFLAVTQMAMRKRQLDDMHQFYGVMMKQMQANMAHQAGDDALRDRLTHEITPWKGSSYDTSGKTGSWWTPDRMQHATDRLVKEAGLSKEGASGLVARWAGVEAPDGPDSKNDIGGGHWGIGQWGRGRDGPQMEGASFDDQLTHAIGELNGKEKDAADVLRNAKTPEEGARGASMYERAGGYNQKTGTDDFTHRTPAGAVYNTVYGDGAKTKPATAEATKTSTGGPTAKTSTGEPVKTDAQGRAIDSTTGKPTAQAFTPYRVAGDVPIPPPTTPAPASNIPIGGGAGNVQEAPTGIPAPDQTITGRTPEMLTPTVGATDPRLQPAASVAPAPAAPAAPAMPDYRFGLPAGGRGGGRYQYVVPAGQQPTQQPTQQAQPAPALPDRTGVQPPPLPPPDTRQGLRPQQVPPSLQPMPPKRPDDLGGATDTSGNIVPGASQDTGGGANANVGSLGGGTGDPLWAGYAGASPDQAASADPLNSLYASGQNFSSSAGLTDTTGLMAAGQMAQMSSMEDSDLTATMYRGGPVIRYRRGGVINRYQQGGDTDEDLLSEYGGTDTSDPMANAYWDQQRVAGLTNNSDPSRASDLPTSIINREAAQQGQGQPSIAPLPLEQPTANPLSQSAQPSDQPIQPSEEPTAPQPTDQPTQTGGIPPGSVQVAGPGGWGSVRSETNIPLPRVGGSMGMGGGMRMPRPSMSTIMRGGGGRQPTGIGHQPLYTPPDDFNHVGLAPVTNQDGSPSVWLTNMIDNGVRALASGFGLMNQGAIPGSPQSAQNIQTFGSNDNPGIPSKEDMSSLGDMIDPKHQLYEGGRDIAGAVGMIKYYAITGQLDAASRLAGGVLLYTRMMSQQYGDEAVKSLFGGDYKNAVKSLEKGYNWVPDGKVAEATDIDEKTGKVHAVQKDGNGKVIAEQDYLPAAIMKAALGLKDGTGFWNMLSSVARAGGNDAIGSHYETQRMLRSIQGNENTPLGPAASSVAPKDTTPITTPPPTPDTTPAPTPDGTTPTTPPPTTPDNSTVSTPPVTPPVPSRDINATVGQAAPQAPQAPPTAMASRGDISNLVAGPAVPSNIQTQPTAPGGSGSVLVAQEQQRAEQAQQSQAVTRMMHQGSFDPDDPYIRQKIADVDKQYLSPLQQQRAQIEQQFAEVEGSDISPADKRALQLALNAKLKNFDETQWKPAVTERNNVINQIGARLKEQFSLQKSIALQQQAEANKRQDQANAYDNQRVNAEQKRQAALEPNHVQLRAHEGVASDGTPLEDKEGKRVLGYGEQLTRNLSDKDDTDATVDANPIARYIRSGNPWLSSSYDGTDPHTVDMTKVPDTLFKQTDRRTMDTTARDMITYNSGDVTFRQAQDFTTGVATGAYTIQRVQHPKIHSRVLGDVDNDDGVARTDVIISRGLGDQNPMRITMSTDNANRLADLAKKAETVSIHNRAMADVRAPAGPTYPTSPDYVNPKGPSGASKSNVAAPPIPDRIQQTLPDVFPKFAPGQSPTDWLQHSRVGLPWSTEVPGANAPPLRPLHPPPPTQQR